MGRGGKRERERETEGEGGSSKPVVVVMNVADPQMTTKWNMVGEVRGKGGKKTGLSSMHRICAFITCTIPSSFFCQLSYLFSYDPINEEPALPPSLPPSLPPFYFD